MHRSKMHKILAQFLRTLAFERFHKIQIAWYMNFRYWHQHFTKTIIFIIIKLFDNL